MHKCCTALNALLAPNQARGGAHARTVDAAGPGVCKTFPVGQTPHALARALHTACCRMQGLSDAHAKLSHLSSLLAAFHAAALQHTHTGRRSPQRPRTPSARRVASLVRAAFEQSARGWAGASLRRRRCASGFASASASLRFPPRGVHAAAHLQSSYGSSGSSGCANGQVRFAGPGLGLACVSTPWLTTLRMDRARRTALRHRPLAAALPQLSPSAIRVGATSSGDCSLADVRSEVSSQDPTDPASAAAVADPVRVSLREPQPAGNRHGDRPARAARSSADSDGIADAEERVQGFEARRRWRGSAAETHSLVACVFCGLELPLTHVGAHQELCAEALPCASPPRGTPPRHMAVRTPPFDAALASPISGKALSVRQRCCAFWRIGTNASTGPVGL